MYTGSNFRNLWGQPIIIAIMTFTGLILALIGDGPYDWIACALLVYPLAKLIYYYWIKVNRAA